MATQFLLFWEETQFFLADFSKNKDGSWTLRRGAICDLPSIKDRSELHKEGLHQLQSTLDSWKVQKGSLHCLLPANRVFLKTVRLEIFTGLQGAIPRLVELEAKRVFPSPLKELIWNYNILPSLGAEWIPVVYVATKKKYIEPLLEIISKTQLQIASISAAPHILCETLPLMDPSQEACLFLDLKHLLINVVLIQPNEVLSSYTIIPSQGSDDLLEMPFLKKIGTDLFRILEHAISQKIIPKKIFVSGKKNQKHQLLPFLQEALKIPTHDLDQLLQNFLSIAPEALEFFTRIFHADRSQGRAQKISDAQQQQQNQHKICELHDDRSYSWSLLVGATTLFQKTPLLDLRPPSLLAKQHKEQQHSYLLAAIVMLACTLLLWSLYLQYETHRLITATSQTLDFLNREEKQLVERDQALAIFQKTEEKKWTLCNLIEERAAWPQLLQELQNALPTPHLWITKLSPIPDEKNNEKNSSLTGITIEGLYLENPRQADVIDDFIAQLKKSDFFFIKNQEEVLLFRSSAEGTAYAYPFQLRLPLRTPIYTRHE